VLSELPLWTWLRIGASALGFVVALVAFAHTLAAASFRHAIGIGLGWAGVSYLLIAGLLCIAESRSGDYKLRDAIGLVVFGALVILGGCFMLGSIDKALPQILGAFGLGVVLLWTTVRSYENLHDKSKPCPECAETIKSNARVCRFCGYRMASRIPVPPSEDA
jgi:hypothetical protein